MSPRRQRTDSDSAKAAKTDRLRTAALPSTTELVPMDPSIFLLDSNPTGPFDEKLTASPSTASPSPPTTRASSFSSVEEASVGLADPQPCFGPNGSYSSPNNSLGLYPDSFLTLQQTPSATGLDLGVGYEGRPSVFYIPDIDNLHPSDYGYSTAACQRSPLRAHVQVASPCAPTMELLGSSFGGYPFPSSLMSATADMAISAAPSSCSSYADLTDLNDSEANLHVHAPFARTLPSRGPTKASAGGGVPDLTHQWSSISGTEKSGTMWSKPSSKMSLGKGQSTVAPVTEPRGEVRHADFESPDGEKKRLRTLQACEKCRVRKAKCNGERPCCGRCTQRNLECYYAPERRMRGPNKKGKEDSSRSGRSRRPGTMATAKALNHDASEDSESEEMDAEGEQAEDERHVELEAQFAPPAVTQQPVPDAWHGDHPGNGFVRPGLNAAPAISQSSGSASSLVIPAPVSHGFLPSAYAPKVSASRQPLSQSFSPSPPIPASPYLPFHLSPSMGPPTTFADAQQQQQQQQAYPPVHTSMGLGMAFVDGQYPPRPPYVRHGHSSSSSSSVSLASSVPALSAMHSGAMLSPQLPPEAFAQDLSSGSSTGGLSRESPYQNYANLPVHPAYQQQPAYGAQYQFPTLNQSMQPYPGYGQPAPYNSYLSPGHATPGGPEIVGYDGTMMERRVSDSRSDMNWQNDG